METHKCNTDGPRHLQELKYTTSSKITQNAAKAKQSQPLPAAAAAGAAESDPNAHSTVQLATNTTTGYLCQRHPGEEGWYCGRDGF